MCDSLFFTVFQTKMAKWQTSTMVPLSTVSHWFFWFEDFSNGRALKIQSNCLIRRTPLTRPTFNSLTIQMQEQEESKIVTFFQTPALTEITQQTTQNEKNFQDSFFQSMQKFQSDMQATMQGVTKDVMNRIDTLETKIKTFSQTGVYAQALQRSDVLRKSLFLLYKHGFNTHSGEVMAVPFFECNEDEKASESTTILVIFIPLICSCLKQWFNVTAKAPEVKAALAQCFNLINVKNITLQRISFYLGLNGALRKPGAQQPMGMPQVNKFAVLYLSEFIEALTWLTSSLHSGKLNPPLPLRNFDEEGDPVLLDLGAKNSPVKSQYQNVEDEDYVMGFSFGEQPYLEALTFFNDSHFQSPWSLFLSSMKKVHDAHGLIWEVEPTEEPILFGNYCLPTQAPIGFEEFKRNQRALETRRKRVEEERRAERKKVVESRKREKPREEEPQEPVEKKTKPKKKNEEPQVEKKTKPKKKKVEEESDSPVDRKSKPKKNVVEDSQEPPVQRTEEDQMDETDSTCFVEEIDSEEHPKKKKRSREEATRKIPKKKKQEETS